MASRPSSSASQHSTRSPKIPTTHVKIPKAATTYSPSDSDPDLRSQINAILLSEGHIEKIQSTLTHTLSSHPSNWPALIRTHALSLLRSGEATSFPQLMERVLQDIRADTAALSNGAANGIGKASTNNGSQSTSGAGLQLGMTPSSRGNGEEGDSSSQSSASGHVPNGKGKEIEARRKGVSLALPKSVVDEGIRVTRECLKDIVTVEE